ncbi:hypothetical protein B0I08_102220 [Glaciihabitans tibetensis]|uniref:Uncharacterized protein n=1 Tax=Glaciihabitans tibetensis TaxID=1266600 RepID=A0A2T0VH53_9MICO|nr:hypothetical protein [Glaciihabitans tibetensis]PRY69544.1 hypothetical protein B0I08_102220 [Glaciihabitans tibetensis]
MSHRHLAVSTSLVLLLALSGCASAAPGDAPAEATTSAAPTEAPATATPSSVPSAAPSIDPADYTCETILPAATLAVFAEQEADGFVLQADFVERSRNFGSDLVYFVDFGGILCQWGYPSGAEPVNYGFSALTADQKAERMARLTEGGFVAEETDRGTRLVNADPASFPDTYLFTDGYWFYGSDSDVLEILVTNVPVS